MTALSTSGSDLVRYEYRTLDIPRRRGELYRQCYGRLGWSEDVLVQNDPAAATVHLEFRRDRRQAGRIELLALQRRVDATLNTIDRLERRPSRVAAVAALTLGVLGVAATAGAVFSVLAGLIPLFITLLVLAIGGYSLPRLLHQRILEWRSAAMAPGLDRHFEDLYNWCLQASSIRS